MHAGPAAQQLQQRRAPGRSARLRRGSMCINAYTHMRVQYVN